jgi:hypothetical protein
MPIIHRDAVTRHLAFEAGQLVVCEDCRTSTGETIISDCTQQVFISIPSDGDWDGEVLPIWQGRNHDNLATLTRVVATVMGSTSPELTFNLEKRPYGDLGSSGTPVFAAPIIATESGIEVTSFDSPTIAPGTYLVLTTGGGAEAGTVDLLALTLVYEETPI